MKLSGFCLLYTPNINVVLKTSNALIYLLHSKTDSKGDVGGQKFVLNKRWWKIRSPKLHCTLAYIKMWYVKKNCVFLHTETLAINNNSKKRMNVEALKTSYIQNQFLINFQNTAHHVHKIQNT
jgi:hypothetical protein